ncbi:unnamed protein product [Discosporangium mesarthrocarpum]
MSPPFNTPIKKYNYERSLFRWVMARHPEPFEKQGITTRTLERAPRAREAFYTSDWRGARSLVRITKDKKFERTPLLDGIIDRGLQGGTRFRIDHITAEEKTKLGIYQDSLTGKYFLESYRPPDGRPYRHSLVMKEVEDMMVAGAEAVGTCAKVDIVRKVSETQGRTRMLHITISISQVEDENGDKKEGVGGGRSAGDKAEGNTSQGMSATSPSTTTESNSMGGVGVMTRDSACAGAGSRDWEGRREGSRASRAAMRAGGWVGGARDGSVAGTRGGAGAESASIPTDGDSSRRRLGRARARSVEEGRDAYQNGNGMRTRAARGEGTEVGAKNGRNIDEGTRLMDSSIVLQSVKEESMRRPPKRPYLGIGSPWDSAEDLSAVPKQEGAEAAPQAQQVQANFLSDVSWPIPDVSTSSPPPPPTTLDHNSQQSAAFQSNSPLPVPVPSSGQGRDMQHEEQPMAPFGGAGDRNSSIDFAVHGGGNGSSGRPQLDQWGGDQAGFQRMFNGNSHYMMSVGGAGPGVGVGVGAGAGHGPSLGPGPGGGGGGGVGGMVGYRSSPEGISTGIGIGGSAYANKLDDEDMDILSNLF